MHFHAIVPDIRSSGEPENIRTTYCTLDDFPAVWNYRKLSAKFLVSSVKVIDTVDFCRFFFLILLEQLLKFLLTNQ